MEEVFRSTANQVEQKVDRQRLIINSDRQRRLCATVHDDSPLPAHKVQLTVKFPFNTLLHGKSPRNRRNFCRIFIEITKTDRHHEPRFVSIFAHVVDRRSMVHGRRSNVTAQSFPATMFVLN